MDKIFMLGFLTLPTASEWYNLSQNGTGCLEMVQLLNNLQFCAFQFAYRFGVLGSSGFGDLFHMKIETGTIFDIRLS